MSYTLILDGGGTKTLSILFDENMKLLGTGRSGGMNTNFESMETVRSHLRESLYTCIDAAGVTELDRFCVAGPGPAKEAEKLIREKVTLKSESYESIGEGTNGVYAGLAADCGVAVLAGTGSRVDYQNGPDIRFATGGWGAFLGDEGSGPWIGLHAINAAIAYNDGWGPATCLKDMIIEEWGLERLWGVVPRCFTGTRPIRVELASLSPLVGRAARSGDEVAIGIYKDAAAILATQTLAMFRNKNIDPTTPVVTAGSAWKGSPVMVEHFAKLIHEVYPDAPVSTPIFDPIMGGVIIQALNGRHKLPEDELARLKADYAAFLFRY